MTEYENSDITQAARPSEKYDLTPLAKKPKSRNLFQRLFHAFSSSDHEDEALRSHKIAQYRQAAEDVRVKLEAIREELRDKVDDELFPMIKEVIDPILRDVERINRHVKRGEGTASAVAEFKAWMEKAKLWVELFRNSDRTAIVEKVIDHIIEKSLERIERDIVYIVAYFRTNRNFIDLPETKRELLEEDIAKLRALQKHPGRMSLEQVNIWRQRLDHQRAKIFQEALDQIER